MRPVHLAVEDLEGQDLAGLHGREVVPALVWIIGQVEAGVGAGFAVLLGDDGADQVAARDGGRVADGQGHALDRPDRPPEVHVDHALLQQALGVFGPEGAHPVLDGRAVEVDVGVVGDLDPFLAHLAAHDGEEGDNLAGAGQPTHDALGLGIVALLDLGSVQEVDVSGGVDEGEPVEVEARALGRQARVADAHRLGDQLEGRAVMIVGVQQSPVAGGIGEADHSLDEGLDVGLRGAGLGDAHGRLELEKLRLTDKARFARRGEGKAAEAPAVVPPI